MVGDADSRAPPSEINARPPAWTAAAGERTGQAGAGGGVGLLSAARDPVGLQPN